jgi:hypothetical protein
MAKGPGGKEVGRVSVRVVPDTSKFRQELKAKLEAIERSGLSIKIPVKFDVSEVDKAKTKLKKSGVQSFGDKIKKGLTEARDALGKTANVVGSFAQNSGRALATLSRYTLITAAIGAAGAGLVHTLALVASLGSELGQIATGGLGVFTASLAGMVALFATIKVGVSGVGDALKNLSDPSALAESLKKLAPNAQKFVLAVKGLQPAFQSLKMDVQQRLFAGMDQTFTRLAGRTLPIVKFQMDGLAGALNGAAKQVVNVITSSANLNTLRDSAKNITQGFINMTLGAAPFTQALIQIVNAGSHQLPRLGAAISSITGKFAAFIDKAAKDGRLDKFFSSALDKATQLGRSVRDLFVGLKNVFSIASASTGGFLNNLQAMAKSFRAWTESLDGQKTLRTFFVSINEIVRATAPVFGALARVIATSVAPILATLAKTLGPAVTIVIKSLGLALNAAAPGIQLFAQGFSAFAEALAPAIPAIGEFFGTLLGFVGQILRGIGPSFSDFLKKLAEALTKVFSNKDLTNGLISVGKAFLDLAKALVPLIEPLGKLVTALLPPLVDALKVATAIAKPLVTLIGFLVEKISALGPAADIAVPALGALAIAFGGTTAKGLGFLALFDIEKKPEVFKRFVDSADKNIAQRLPRQVLDPAGTAVITWVDEVKKAMLEAAGATASATGQMGSSVAGLVPPLGQAGGAAGANFGGQIGAGLSAASERTQGWMDTIKQMVFGIVDPLGAAGSAAGASFAGGLGGALGGAVGSSRAVMTAIRGTLNGDFSSAGSAVMASFAEGIARSTILAEKAVRDAMLKVSRFFPHSPAKAGAFSGKGWTEFSGRALAEGFASGIEGGTPAAIRATEAMMAGASSRATAEWRGVISSGDFGGVGEEVASALSEWSVVIDANGVAKLVRKADTRNKRRG